MRKHERMGVSEGTLQGQRNRARVAEAARRGVHPSHSFSVADRFTALGMAAHYRYRQMAWRNLKRGFEDTAERGYVRSWLARARGCDKPRIPT